MHSAILMLRDFEPEHSIKLGVPADRRGEVTFYLTISYRLGRLPSEPLQSGGSVRVPLPFRCSSKGDLQYEKKAFFISFPGPDLLVDLQLYQKREPLSDLSLPGIPDLVWKQWMKQLHILKIVFIAKLTKKKWKGGFSVTVNPESVKIPEVSSGSTGEDTAVVGPMTIELEPVEVTPPLTTPQGLLYYVYFDVDSSELDKVVDARPFETKHQGKGLEDWIRKSLTSQWDIMAALTWQKLAVRMEARASATGKGSPAEIQHYNYELSKKRLDAVVNRLKKIIAEKDKYIELDTTRMEAWGDLHSPPEKKGVEDVNERRCVIKVDADDLKKAIKELYSREFGGTSMLEFGRRGRHFEEG
jgi:hypothetical protein